MSEEERSPLRIILIIVAAIVIPVVVVGGYVLFNRAPNPHTGQIVSLNAYPIHREITQPTTTEGVGGQTETYDQLLLFVDVRIQNTAKVPLFVHDMWSTVNLPDENQRSTAVSGSDFDKVFIAYPDTKQYQKPPLQRDITIQPGQQVEGEMIFSYQISQAQWQSATGMNVGISFLHQNPLILQVATK